MEVKDTIRVIFFLDGFLKKITHPYMTNPKSQRKRNLRLTSHETFTYRTNFTRTSHAHTTDLPSPPFNDWVDMELTILYTSYVLNNTMWSCIETLILWSKCMVDVVN